MAIARLTEVVAVRLTVVAPMATMRRQTVADVAALEPVREHRSTLSKWPRNRNERPSETANLPRLEPPMSDQPHDPIPEPGPESGTPVLATTGVNPPSDARRTAKVWLPWVIIAGVASIVLAVGGAFAYVKFIKKDSGIAACEAMRDDATDNQSEESDEEITETEYRQTRSLFENSKHDDIKDHGTKLIDVIWSVSQLPDDEGMGALAFIGPLTTHATGLQSACADHGIVFNLLDEESSNEEGLEGSPPPSEGDDGEPVESSAATPAGRTVTYPDGITLTLDKVEKIDPALAADLPKGKTVVRVTYSFANNGQQMVPLETCGCGVTLLYGPNRVEGESNAGFFTDDPKKQLQSDDDATRIAPGQKVTYWDSAEVDTTSLGDLAAKIQAPVVPADESRDPYLFTDLHTMLSTN